FCALFSRPLCSTLFPYTTLFRSILFVLIYGLEAGFKVIPQRAMFILMCCGVLIYGGTGLFGVILGAHFLSFEPFLSNPQAAEQRSEEHTSELQSRFDIVCRLLLE